MCGDVKIIIWKRYVVLRVEVLVMLMKTWAEDDCECRRSVWTRASASLSIWLKAMEKRLLLQRKLFHSHVIN